MKTPFDQSILARQIELFLLDRGTWISAQEICIKFGISERDLRATGEHPGICDEYALSSHKGYKHLSLVDTAEFLPIKHRMLAHAIGEVRKVKRWTSARLNCKWEIKPTQVEKHTGQKLLPL